jgi:hypothetical protein
MSDAKSPPPSAATPGAAQVAAQAAPQPAPEPAFFDNPAIDHLVAVTLELGAELWAQRERTRVVERLLARQGVVTAAAIEQYVPTEADLATAKAERDEFVQRVFGAFARQTVKATPDAAA